MDASRLRRINIQYKYWIINTLPALFAMGGFLLVRSFGLTQNLELKTLDLFLKYRLGESQDSHITLIKITEEDLQSLPTSQKYPVPDQETAKLLEKLISHDPAVISFNMYRPDPVNPGHQTFARVLSQSTTPIVTAKKILPQQVSQPPAAQISGFTDSPVDLDGKSRRVFLGVTPTGKPEDFELSLFTQVAEIYLSKKFSCELADGIEDPNAFSLCGVEIPRFQSNSLGYVNADNAGVQMVINFRAGIEPFKTLYFQDIINGQFKEEDLKDKIILIGMGSTSIKSFVNTHAVRSSSISGQIYGVEYDAHVISHLINTAINERVSIYSWTDFQEYLFLTISGISVLAIMLYLRASLYRFFFVLLFFFISIPVSYTIFIYTGLFIPILPMLINSITIFLVGLVIYESIVEYSNKVRVRQETIYEIFMYIHNGPLQELNLLIRELETEKKDSKDNFIIERLKQINDDIRAVRKFVEEYLNSKNQDELIKFMIGDGSVLSLDKPIEELLLEIYERTLNRELPCFKNIFLKIREFDVLDDSQITSLQKEQLCHFLEECICNIGKHAENASRIDIIGKNNQDTYCLSIQDNGVGISEAAIKKILHKFQPLRRSLKAQLLIKCLESKGTLCQLTWKSRKKAKLTNEDMN